MRGPVAISRITVTAAAASALLIAGCGGGQRQDAKEPKGNFKVQVVKASFPAQQDLSDHTTMKIAVRNAGTRTVPDVAVTIERARRGRVAGAGTVAQAFSYTDPQVGLAMSSRPIWIIDVAPTLPGQPAAGPYQGGGVTAYSNTWALGTLFPGETRVFTWKVTSVRAGHYRVYYRVAAGLAGKAKAVLPGGGIPQGVFTVNVTGRPAQATVNDAGQVVRKP